MNCVSRYNIEVPRPGRQLTQDRLASQQDPSSCFVPYDANLASSGTTLGCEQLGVALAELLRVQWGQGAV